MNDIRFIDQLKVGQFSPPEGTVDIPNIRDLVVVTGSNRSLRTYSSFIYREGMLGVGNSNPQSIVDIRGTNKNLLSIKNANNNGIGVDLDGLLLIKERDSFNFNMIKPKGSIVFVNGELFIKI
jgi:hypothetical protein